MGFQFESDLSIAAPPQVVFAACTDFEQMQQWMPGFVGVEKLTKGPFAIGTQFKETRKMMGHNASEVFEVTACDPPHRLDLYVDGRKGSMKKGAFHFRYEFIPQAGGTLLRARGELVMPGLGAKIFAFFMRKVIVAGCRKDLHSMKAFVEKNAAAKS